MKTAIMGWVFELYWDQYWVTQERCCLLRKESSHPFWGKLITTEVQPSACSLKQKWCMAWKNKALASFVQDVDINILSIELCPWNSLIRSNNPLDMELIVIEGSVVRSHTGWGWATEQAQDGPCHQTHVCRTSCALSSLGTLSAHLQPLRKFI